jgi:acyl transferase domain-containing protein/thioesterase domain-containing protein
MYRDAGAFDPKNETEVPEAAVAIVGMSCRFAGARGLDAYWDLLCRGGEGIETYDEETLLAAGVNPATLRKPNYVPRGASLEDMECFDAGLFGLSPRDAAIMDPQHRHFLECAWEALENAGHVPQRFPGAIGVFAGSGHNAYMPSHLLTNPKLVRDIGLFLLRHTSNDKDFLTTRLSYLLDLKGPSINVQTACSTSLVSIHMAAQSLLNGECDMALAGGASIELPHRQGYLFEEGEILSPDGHCRPFDAESRGTVFGSGIAVVVLRRLSDAIEDGDHIYAVVRGSAINNDGAGKVGYLAPSVDGQAKVIAEALAMADVEAGTIGYVETHGTGTPVGDPIEIAALTQAFRETTDRAGYCAIGSVKGNIGHTDTAAGAAGLIKVALALSNRELPPSLNFGSPNPDCAFAGSPFFVQARRAGWEASGHPRRAGVSSLGVGGTNAHVILEEAPPRRRSGPGRTTQLLLCSARSDTALRDNAAALARHFAANAEASLPDAAFTLGTGRQHLNHRCFVVADSAAEAAEKLGEHAERIDAAAPCVADRPVAFLFCGAGAQHADMARGLYQTEPVFRAAVDEALALLDRIGVREIGRWLFPVAGDRARAAAEMERPSIALPALFTIQVALARFWMSLGVRPCGMIGHSSGEYAAAHLAGVIDLEAGLRIVSARGQLFETVERGGMLSVPMSEDDLVPLLPPELSIAAINAPRLCVVSGPSDAIALFRDDLAAREVEAQLVRISVAAHSRMLDPILPQFQKLMDSIKLRPPRLPFVSNLTGDWVSDSEATDPGYWVRHLRQTVRFTDGLQRLLDDPECALLEVGPGRAMASLVRQHPERTRTQPVLSSLPHPEQPVADQAFFWSSLGQLWELGVTIDWDAYWAGERRCRLPLPTYQFERQRHWIEAGSIAGQFDDDRDSLDRRDDVADWYFEPVWARTPRLAGKTIEGAALIFEDDAGLAGAIRDHLHLEGREVVSVRPGARFRQQSDALFVIDPANPCDYARLFDQLSAAGKLPAQIYHCWGVTGAPRWPRRARQSMDRGFFSLAAMAPQLARQAGEEPVEIAVVTDRVQRVACESGLMPEKATVLGAARVIPAEYPNLKVRTIDIALPKANARRVDDIARSIIGELAQEGEASICYRDGERWVQEYRPAGKPDAHAPRTPPIRPGGVYLITGGLGGIGLTIARHLAERRARIALVTRSPLPPRGEWADLLANRAIEPGLAERLRKLLALEATGSAVEVFVADVCDARAMRRVVRSIRSKLGAITGVFHAAGSLDDGLIETRSRQAMEAVLRPKVAGTIALDRALRRERPEFMLLFSSISAFAGLPGQADYAAANAFLDSYAQARHDDPHTCVLSVGWSQWREVGMAAALRGSNGGAPDLPEQLEGGEAIDHPFLERLHCVSTDSYVATATLAPQLHWLLDEHRVVGAGALIPGTGYLELVRAAHEMIDPGPAALSDIVFLSPFAVADGAARELRVHLQRRVGSDWRFTVLGRPSGTMAWVEHASGVVRPLRNAEAPQPLDLVAIEARCDTIVEGMLGRSHVLNFGPRWNNVTRTSLGAGEALLRLELAPAFHADLDAISLHPALLDLATAGAQSLIGDYDAGRDFFAPFSYRRIMLHAPLPATIVSHVRYRSPAESGTPTAVFDVTVTDEAGMVFASICEFTMIRIRDTSLLSAGAHPTDIAVRTEQAAPIERLDGILPEEGLCAVNHLLAGTARSHVIVSPYALAPALAHLRAPHRAARRVVASGSGDSGADLPATATERVIAELWQDMLGVVPVRRTDNFFDLGGHSLLAVQFTNRFRKKTGKVLPLAALLDTPTVQNLARIVDPESAVIDGDEAIAGVTPDPTRDVVTIRAGGSLTPVFFVHDGLGETLLYRGLALRLDPERAVYGVEPLRTEGGAFAHTRIDEMASNYIERIRRVQPHGPYLLAGLCAGGVIAFEMARQLQDLGEHVAFVGIIDAADVATAKRPFYITRSRLSRVGDLMRRAAGPAMLVALSRRAANAIAWEIGTRIRQARDRRTVRLIKNANEAGLDPAADTGAAPAIAFLQLYEVAHRAHRPAGLFSGGDVTVFKATEGNGAIEDVPYQEVYSDFALGWGRRVEDDVTVVAVPGGHGSALQEPHVAALARQFQNAVDSAVEGVEMEPPRSEDAGQIAAAVAAE